MLIHEARRDRRHVLAAAAILVVPAWNYGSHGIVTPLLACVMAELWIRPRPIRELALVRFLSDRSYSVYLLHGPILSMLGSVAFAATMGAGAGRPLAAMAAIIAVIATVYTLAWLADKLVHPLQISF